MVFVYDDALGQIVHPRAEHDVVAGSEGLVDGRGRVARGRGHVHLGKGGRGEGGGMIAHNKIKNTRHWRIYNNYINDKPEQW